MATRMQQRRGTAAQWISTNSGNGPVLNPGEIGWESDTNKFKIGDGVNHWINLPYFVDLNTTIAGAPGLLNSLDELAAAIGDDPAFFTTVATNLTNHQNDTTAIHGIADTSLLVTTTGTQTLTNKTITTPAGLVKGDVGLGNVDNTSDANKPVSTATQTALDAKLASATAASTYAPLASPTFTGTVSGVTKAHVGLGNVDNTADSAKPVSTATQTALDAKAPLASPTFTGTVVLPSVSATGHIIPSTDNTYDLGSPTHMFKDIYVGPGSLYVNGQKVLQDVSGAIVVSADINENLGLRTSGDGNIELDPTGTGNINIKGPLVMQAATNISSADGNAVTFGGAINTDTISSKTANTDLSITANGTGKVYLNDNTEVSGNLVVGGNLTISGTTTSVNTETISLADNIIDLNSNFTTGSPTENAGIRIMRGDSNAVQVRWNESADKWEFTNDGTNYSVIAGLDSPTFTGTVSGVTKAHVGLGNVDNTSDANKPVSTATQTALDAKLASATAASTYAPLASPTFTGTVTLPSGTVTSTMIADGTIANADINASAEIAQSKIANLTTDLAAKASSTDLSTHASDTTLIHGIADTNELATKDYVTTAVGNATIDQTGQGGVGINWNSVSEAFDIDTLTTADLTTAQTLTNKTLTSPVINTPTGITKSDVGLANVDNTTDANKPVSTATQTALDLKLASATAASTYAPLASPTFTGTVSAAALTLSGDLTVNGTTTTINSTTLSVDDKNVVLGDVATPSDATADGGGITLKGATDKTFNWVDATDAWTSSEHINLASGKTLKYNGTDLVASQTGNSGKYLTTDGTSTSWGTVSGYSAPTLGSTSIASGATVTTVAGLTLTAPTLTGTVTASGDINLSAANGPGSLLDELALILMGAL